MITLVAVLVTMNSHKKPDDRSDVQRSAGPLLAPTSADCTSKTSALISVTVEEGDFYTENTKVRVRTGVPVSVVVDTDEPLPTTLRGSDIVDSVEIPEGVTSFCVTYEQPGTYNIEVGSHLTTLLTVTR